MGDHIAFLQAAIPTAFIFNDSYSHRYTSADTLDKVNADELEKIGRTLQTWLEEITALE